MSIHHLNQGIHSDMFQLPFVFFSFWFIYDIYTSNLQTKSVVILFFLLYFEQDVFIWLVFIYWPFVKHEYIGSDFFFIIINGILFFCLWRLNFFFLNWIVYNFKVQKTLQWRIFTLLFWNIFTIYCAREFYYYYGQKVEESLQAIFCFLFLFEDGKVGFSHLLCGNCKSYRKFGRREYKRMYWCLKKKNKNIEHRGNDEIRLILS